MATRDPIRIVEAAYRWCDDERAWLDGIIDAASAYEVGSGLVGYTVELAGPPRVHRFSLHGDEHARRALTALTKSFGKRLARAMYAPTEYAGNAAWRFSHAARRCDTTIQAVERRAGQALPAMWAVCGGDPRRRAVVLGFPTRRRIAEIEPFPSRLAARQLGLVAAHLGAALRLRDAIGPPSTDDAATDAVVTPAGKILHAQGAALERRRSIADAARRSEHARLRGVPHHEALELWTALVDGRWSIVDVEERDGKRFLLARRNPVAGRDIAALDDLDRDVAWLASMGHSHKFIAYELGMSVQVVVRRLERVLRRLGIPSRRDLVRIFAADSSPRTGC